MPIQTRSATKNSILLPLSPRKTNSLTMSESLSESASDESGIESDSHELSAEREDSSSNENDGVSRNDDEFSEDEDNNYEDVDDNHPTNRKECEWSQETRNFIVAWSIMGMSQRAIAKELDIPRTTVQSIIHKYDRTGTVENKPRPGRPPKLDARALRRLDWLVTKNAEARRAPLAEITEELNADVCERTVRRGMKKIGINCRPAAIKPFVSKENAKKRVEWCKEKLDWTEEDWANVCWSDECSVEVRRSHKHTMVWRRVGERMDPACLQPSFKSGRKIVMVWGCFIGKELGPLVAIDKDRGKVNSSNYCQLLKETLVPFLRKHPGATFMQDNAPIHNSKFTKTFLQKKGITAMKWPAQSPDLNPIENIWNQLKIALDKRRPRVKNEDELIEAMQEEWGILRKKNNNCQMLVRSMPKRLEMVVQSKGMPIKY
jgi:transposase